jgi:hypothetical protein
MQMRIHQAAIIAALILSAGALAWEAGPAGGSGFPFQRLHEVGRLSQS